MAHFNQLTNAQTERLDMLQEECAEVIQIISKIKRHGYESHHPDTPGEDNREFLERELGDMLGVLDHMLDHNDVSYEEVKRAAHQKMKRARKYMHHYEEPSVTERERAHKDDGIWAAFYRDGHTLGEIKELWSLSSIYVLSPWLTKPISDVVMDITCDTDRRNSLLDASKILANPLDKYIFKKDNVYHWIDEEGDPSPRGHETIESCRNELQIYIDHMEQKNKAGGDAVHE